MNRKQRIKQLLSSKIDDFLLEIIDNSHLHSGHNNFTGKNETHIKIILRNKTKSPINRLELHRLINNLLKKEFNAGLHSVEIKIK
tara:strand:+ start:711 stop:965 length:255 start_codon:yes stop_codon:yes gene_type:complete